MITTPAQVKAASITILNPSFESPTAPVQPDGAFYTINDITDWTVAGSNPQGVFNPSASQAITSTAYFSQPVPNGVQTAFSNGGNIFQQLSATLQPNTQYTLGAFVGRRNDLGLPGYDIQLLAGSTVIASNNSIIPSSGTFAPVTVNYNTNSTDPLIGQFLTIRLFSSDVQTNFDDITLDATPVPEPSPLFGLLAIGALGAGASFKHKLTTSKFTKKK